MAEDLGRLLATSIAQLEQRLSAQIGGGFEEVNKKMNKIEKKVDEIEEMMETMEETIMEKVEETEERIMEQLTITRQEKDRESSIYYGRAGSLDEEEVARDYQSRQIRRWDEERGWSSADYTDTEEEEDRRTEESGWSSGEYTDAENDGTKTAIEPGALPKVYHSISWKVGDENIKKMQTERMSKDEEIPSFWNYDPRCLPKEFIDLDKKTFLVDPSAFNLCFLDKDILRKISKMLDPIDFLNLSYTCRYLHWRLFTFCTCYVPCCVWMHVRDQTVGYYAKCEEDEYRLYQTAPSKIVYSLLLDEDVRRSMLDLAKEEGLRAIVARIPSCLRKPFFFDRLRVSLHLHFFTKEDFNRCLTFILPLRKYVRELIISMYYRNQMGAEQFFDYQAVNDFLQTLNATSYDANDQGLFSPATDRTLMVFENCPYARQIDDIRLYLRSSGSKYENAVFFNRTGYYDDPPVSAIIRTINEFCYGTTNLDYHQYKLQDVGKQAAFLEYFYANYDDFEEYYRDHTAITHEGPYNVPTRVTKFQTVKFATVMTEETGRKHMMRVVDDPGFYRRWLIVTFGNEKAFAERQKFSPCPELEKCRTGKNWCRIETAIEPEEGGKEETTAGEIPNRRLLRICPVK